MCLFYCAKLHKKVLRESVYIFIRQSVERRELLLFFFQSFFCLKSRFPFDKIWNCQHNTRRRL